MKLEFSQQIFLKGKLFHVDGQTDRWMDMMKPTVASCNFLNVPKK